MLTNLARSDSSEHQVYRVGEQVARNTDIAVREEAAASWLNARNKRVERTSTSIQPVSNSFKVGPEDSSRRIDPQRQRLRTVEIAVLAVEGAMVICEAFLPTRTASLQIPKGLFPEEPHFGKTFDLSMTEEGGVRKPLLVASEGRREADAALKAEMARIIEQL